MPRLKSILILAIVTIVAVTAGLSLSQDATAQSSPGTATISDDQALSDAITYRLNVPPPSDGSEYVGWLLANDGAVKLSTGPMDRGADGSINHTFDRDNGRYTGENLIEGYDTVVITEEAAGSDPDAPAGPAVYHSQLPMDAVPHIRAIVGDGSPADALRTQLAAAHQMANAAKTVSSLADAKDYLEGVVNLIEGTSNDIDGNGSVNDPGDGVGILAHAASIIDSAVAAAGAGASGGGSVEAAATHAHTSAGMARDEAMIAINSATQVLARLAAGGAAGFLDGALNGTPESGGAAQAYVAGQMMATYNLQVGAPPEPTPTPTPIPTATPVPTPTPVPPPPTPVPTPTAIPPAAGDSSVPAAMQLVLVLSVLLLAAGATFALRGRRDSA